MSFEVLFLDAKWGFFVLNLALSVWLKIPDILLYSLQDVSTVCH